MAKLFTHHDPYHIHALVGFLAVWHYLYRLPLLLQDVPDSGFGQDAFLDIISLVTMVLPLATSLLLDHVPITKTSADGFSIWKEYRWHALIFGGRCWLLLILFVYHRHGHDHRHYISVRILTVFASQLLASYVSTRLYPPQASSTIRGMYSHPASVFAAGFIQFLWTAFTVNPSIYDDINIQFLSIVVIQLNAFNMTLRKKRITGPLTTQLFYSIMLVSGSYVIFVKRFLDDPPVGMFDPRFRFVYLASMAYFFRRILGCNRFLSWGMAMALVELGARVVNIF